MVDVMVWAERENKGSSDNMRRQCAPGWSKSSPAYTENLLTFRSCSMSCVYPTAIANKKSDPLRRNHYSSHRERSALSQ
jgi:hypothetical protein